MCISPFLPIFSFSTASLRQRIEALRQTWNNRSTLEKGLLIAVVALIVLALGLIIGLAASAGKDKGRAQGLFN